MRILNSFDMYFLAMMLIQGTIVFTVDAKSFTKAGMDGTSRKARILGLLAIIVTSALFILRLILL
ncbi:hypothetical protein LGK97_05480 [Clostridium sp. CS001]|uniref:CLC_0170 family protein n=1 Tax=Clostridium sp. CS001 TaxID=2880648 RepID=UPI001CF52405|nr:CLC_0170 family protein [Clostridium sp. CS001]MCB2289214.1 hypothetical protein [Clostridium sp. CS001]